MCTVTLSYDKKDARARDMLAMIIESGLFYVNDIDSLIDYSDPWLYEDHGDLPPLPQAKETFSLDEFRDILIDDLRDIYNVKDETVSVCH